ncbi:MAG: hypothetical protein AB7S92_13225 [Parvibaculaceae bacterium]|jgi:hypothetical protein
MAGDEERSMERRQDPAVTAMPPVFAPPEHSSEARQTGVKHR